MKNLKTNESNFQLIKKLKRTKVKNITKLQNVSLKKKRHK